MCLERLDSTVNGITTIQCHHTFHCVCLSKWADDKCPVCRYSQRPNLNECSTCKTTENLWTCLICGYLGCGRYKNAHAISHFQQTNHIYSLELETQRVWDYERDGYVHRILQSNEGKLLNAEVEQAGKNEILEEYDALLVAQLESQRFYFENILESCVTKHSDEVHAIKTDLESKIAFLQEFSEKETFKLKEANKSLQDRLNALKTKYSNLLTDHQNVQEKYAAEEILSSNLLENHKVLKEELKTCKAELMELEEQNKDLLFHFQSMNVIENSELKEGQIVTKLAENKNPRNKKKKK